MTQGLRAVHSARMTQGLRSCLIPADTRGPSVHAQLLHIICGISSILRTEPLPKTLELNPSPWASQRLKNSSFSHPCAIARAIAAHLSRRPKRTLAHNPNPSPAPTPSSAALASVCPQRLPIENAIAKIEFSARSDHLRPTPLPTIVATTCRPTESLRAR
jgi:hypothetical protein